MNGLEAEYADKGIAFVRLDANQPDNEAFQRTFGLRGHPTVVVLDVDSQAVAQFIGIQSAETLKEILDKIDPAPD